MVAESPAPQARESREAEKKKRKALRAIATQETPQSPLARRAEEHVPKLSEKAARKREARALRKIAKAQARAELEKERVDKLRQLAHLQKLRMENAAQVTGEIKPRIALDERKKDRVAQFALLFTRGKLPDLAQAREDLEYLKEVDHRSWQKGDRDRYLFVENILRSIIKGKMPPSIVQPDGKYFKWPGTNIGNPSAHGSAIGDMQEVGVLKSIGYQVGLQGVPLHERRRLLSRVYEHELAMALSRSYLSEWGKPKSSLRLRKLAHTIASLTRNMKRRNSDAPSIEDWEADLAYLKQHYYVGRYDFQWPRS
ncbi:MAG: hypothetical protein EXR12_00010 [Rhodospirillaceae bacterium]|nr:hypothetical protein [Rhodospirillaceae bacterium]